MIIDKTSIEKLLKSKRDTENKFIFIEEMAELQKTITKSYRGVKNKADMVEEMADVYIILEMMKQSYNISDERLQGTIDFKMSRNLKRVK